MDEGLRNVGAGQTKNALAVISDELESVSARLHGNIDNLRALNQRAFGSEPEAAQEDKTQTPAPQGAVDRLKYRCQDLQNQADTLENLIGRLDGLV